MQSIFRPASRREMLGEHAGGGRRDGGLKMGWTKRSGCKAIAMGTDCRLDLGWGSEAAGSDERVGCCGCVALPPVSCHGVGGSDWCVKKFSPRCAWQHRFYRLARPSLPGIVCSASNDSPLHHEVSLIDTCLGHPVGITADVVQYLLGSGERPLGVHHPFGLAGGSQVIQERRSVPE